MSKTGIPVKTVELVEWQTIVVPDLELTQADKTWLAKQVETEKVKRFCQFEELKAGLKITTTSWVGVLHLERLRIVVRPKLAGDNLRVMQMLEFTMGLQGLHRLTLPNKLQMGQDQDNLFDLLALLLVEECIQVVKAGLLSDYIQRENTLMVVRGRLLADRQGLKHFGRVDRLECRYDEHETDTPENQLLAIALKICSRYVQDPNIRLAVRKQDAILSEICDASEFNPRMLRQTLVYHRVNEHYRYAHTLAWLILDSLGIQDLFNSGHIGPFAFMLDMNLLFEQFVWRALEKLCRTTGLRVRYQSKNKSILWDAANHRTYRQIIPDLLVEKAADKTPITIPVDAKYKLYDQNKISNSDLYQMFLYAFAYAPAAEPDQLPQALLVYPSASATPLSPVIIEVHGQVGQTHARIRGLGLHIPSLLDEFHNKKEPVYSSLLMEQFKLASVHE